MLRLFRVANQVTPHLSVSAPNLAFSLVCAAAFATLSALSPVRAGTTGLGNIWYKGHFSKTRLIGARQNKDGVERIFAGVEIVLDKGWKTYWRQPGNAGGVPPSFNWSHSTNVESIEVLYPAPQRFKGTTGSTVGYKNRVLFPVKIVPIRATDPVELKLTVQYGICATICVPVRETLSLTIPPGSTAGFPPALTNALANVPRESADRATADPNLINHTIDLDGPSPKIVLQVDFNGHTDGADAFVEVTGDIFLPPAKPRPDLGPATFTVDLSTTQNLTTLKGRTLTVTLVSTAGQSVTHFKIK